MVGAIGSSATVHGGHAEEQRVSSSRFHELHGMYPDRLRRRDVRGLEWLGQVITKPAPTTSRKVIDAWEDSTYEGLEGPFFMRKCDHQAVQTRVRGGGGEGPEVSASIPKILATYPGDR